MKFLKSSGLLFLFFLFAASDLHAKGAAASGEWVTVPSKWLLTRFARSSTTPAKEYRVAVAIPAGSNLRTVSPTIAKSSGVHDVDLVAADYAKHVSQASPQVKQSAKRASFSSSSVSRRPRWILKCGAKPDGVRFLRAPIFPRRFRRAFPFPSPKVA